MRIQLKNMGALKQADFTLGRLTVICGSNNTGKTYATYALVGFLSFWRSLLHNPIPESSIHKLLNEGVIELNIQDYLDQIPTILENASKSYTKILPYVFASSENKFSESIFTLDVDISEIRIENPYEKNMGAAKKQLFFISKKENSPLVTITLLVEKEIIKISLENISKIIDEAIKEIVFDPVFPRTFIASAERTGAAIFRKELNFARNRLLEEMSTLDKGVDPLDLLAKVYADYALPVKQNVDFTRKLEEISKNTSCLSKSYPQALHYFSDIIGGKYKVTRNDELYYEPKGKRIRLTMDESSSAVRSLLDIGFYLHHVAAPGDMLVVDEPELNLHPENQRRIARLFARLVNHGIQVFITTHSDYIIKELNTLIMLHQEEPRINSLAEREGYHPSELLNPDDVKVYVAEEALIKLDGGMRKTRAMTLVASDIDPRLGIEVTSFDKTIDEMNRIQDEIIWGVESDHA